MMRNLDRNNIRIRLGESGKSGKICEELKII